MAEKSTPSSSSPKSAHQQPIEPSNSQQRNRQQLVQTQQQNNDSDNGLGNNDLRRINSLIGDSNFQGLQMNPSTSRLNNGVRMINSLIGDSGFQGNVNGVNQLAVQQQQNPLGHRWSIQSGTHQHDQMAMQPQNQLGLQQQYQMGMQQQNQVGRCQSQIGVQQQNQLGQQQNQMRVQQKNQLGMQQNQMPLWSGQADAAADHFNLQYQFLTSPRQKEAFLQGSQFHPGNIPGQSLQAKGMMESHNLSSQLRADGALAYAQQRMNPTQLRQQFEQQNGLEVSQGQRILRSSFVNAQISGMPQNGQPGVMQNALSQEEHQQFLLQQQITSSQLQQNYNQEPSMRIMVHGGQRFVSLTGSHPGATASGFTMPGGNSSQGYEARNHFIGKRKIQDLVSQLDPNGRLDPEVEDIVLELADDFIDSVIPFACSLAKHRKSTTLETKDMLLHLEKNWNLIIPGYSSKEKGHIPVRTPSENHKKRRDMIRNIMSGPNSTVVTPQIAMQQANRFS